MKKTDDFRLDKNLISGFEKLFALIQKSQGILISGHVNPDGDDLGSQLALSHYLSDIGKPHLLIDEEEIPERFQFLPGSDRILSFDEAGEIDLDEYDLFIVVDSGELSRIGRVTELIGESMTVVKIDHHPSSEHFGSLNIERESASSIGEILFYFFDYFNIEVSKDAATCLFVSIVTDTGWFRFDKMSPNVHLIASELLKIGVVPIEINRSLDQMKPYSYLQLLSRVLNRLELFSENRIAISSLTLDDFSEIGDDETDGMINTIGTIDSVEVYILIKEKEPGFFSASLRSKTEIDVSIVAANIGGGGHSKAAGCRTRDLSLQDFKKKLVFEIEKQYTRGQ